MMIREQRSDLAHQFDLHGNVPRERVGSNRRPGVPSLLPEHIGQQLRRGVHYLGLLVEFRCAGDEPQQLDDALDAVQVAQVGMEHTQQVEHAPPGRILALGEIEVGPQLSGQDVVTDIGPAPCGVEQPSRRTGT